MQGPSLHDAHREILWNVSHPLNSIVMYILFAVSMLIFFWGIRSRIILWKAGRKINDRKINLSSCLKIFFTDILMQKKVNRKKKVAIFHGMIFWGFLVLIFATTVVFIDHDLNIKIYNGIFYLIVSLFSDLFGLGVILAVLYAWHRKVDQTEDGIHKSEAGNLMLFMLALMCLQGFLLEALRISATNDQWAYYSPVGYILSSLLWPLQGTSITTLHFITWWFHTITVFTFIALLPYTKFMHIFSSSINLLFSERTRHTGAMSYPGDVGNMMEKAISEDGEFSIGILNVRDLSWKERMDLDACTACGRCQHICPAYQSGQILSPKWMILDLKDHIHGRFADSQSRILGFQRNFTNVLDQLDAWLINTFSRALDKTWSEEDEELDSRLRKRRGKNKAVRTSVLKTGQSDEAMIAGEVMDENVFWTCNTCRACEEVCPVGVGHLDIIGDVRRGLALMQGQIPKEARQSLKAIETRGNPFGPAEERIDWTQGLEIAVLQPGDSVDILYWVGCIPAYDKRKQSIARSMAKILHASGMSWGILGNKEFCTGDPARRLGEEHLFQQAAKKNIASISEINCTRIVANCPHCFNTLKNEYPQINKNNAIPDTLHHTELILELIKDKKISIKGNLKDGLTWHDPCYLGRHNQKYNEAREVLVQLGSKNITEMRRNKKSALCCGAGGGHFWMDMQGEERINVQRIEEAIKTQASTIATGCPFCLHMLEDGLKLKDKEAHIQVKDLSELIASQLI